MAECCRRFLFSQDGDFVLKLRDDATIGFACMVGDVVLTVFSVDQGILVEVLVNSR